MVEPSFREWLRAEIASILGRKVTPAPLLLWCDADRVWRDLLVAAAEGGAFELWADDAHGLITRERLLAAADVPRVVWVPLARGALGYLKVFELQADLVWTESLLAALERAGVELPRDQVETLSRLLPSYTKERLDRPLSAWRELTAGSALQALVHDDRVLEALASPGKPLTAVIEPERLDVFRRRVDEDFGLPWARGVADDEWRLSAVARLLVTDATIRSGSPPLSETARVIPPGQARDNALRLLERWQTHVDLMRSFATLAEQADARLTLAGWARSLATPAPVLASPAAERALLDAQVQSLSQIEDDVEALVRRLDERGASYKEHAGAFWGSRAEPRVPWASLASLAGAAAAMIDAAGVQRTWTKVADAVAWFTGDGWKLDHEGEALFREDAALPPALRAVRAALRRAYLRQLDACNAVFSELLHQQGVGALQLRFAGEVLAEHRPAKEPVAVLVLDACRYDLGRRIVEALNKGEPQRRADCFPARAPVPSITALGMPLALAETPAALAVDVASGSEARWRVLATDGASDLAIAEGRRQWLRSRYKLRPAAITDVKTLLQDGVPSVADAGRTLFVFGDEFDAQGHEGELAFTGADEYVERYVRVIRRLRDAGFTTVVVVTDHGFVHWEPEPDEIDDPPAGEIAWRSRRAVAGRGLVHATGVKLPIPGSDLECMVPRSVNAFRTYGRVGFFHGGATLQELVIPVVVCRWPRRAQKVAAVLTPPGAITSLRPRVEVGPGLTGFLPEVGPSGAVMGREVVVQVIEPGSGRRLFRSGRAVALVPGGAKVDVVLDRVPGAACQRGARLRVEVRDADNDDEILDHAEADLMVDLEEWD